MIKKRHIVIALGVVSVLLGSLLVNNVLLAQSGSGEYDPWLDYNEDGTIDVNDLSPMGQSYGSSGDPTKNITIVGHATERISIAVGVSIPALGSWTSPYISIDGYAKVTVLVYMTPGGSNEYQLRACNIDWGGYWIADDFVNFAHDYVKTYDVMNQGIRIWLSNNHSGTPVTIYVDVYLMA